MIASQKNLLQTIHKIYVDHNNALDYIRKNLGDVKFTSIEEAKSHMRSLDESKLHTIYFNLFPPHYVGDYFDNIVSKLKRDENKLRIGTLEREKISNLIDQILALKCQTMVYNKILADYYLYLEEDYP